LKQKEESIIYVCSGSKAVYKTVRSLEKLLNDYSTVSPTDPIERQAIPPCWIDIQYPTVETMVLISRAFGIHTLTMEDCLSETEDQHQKNELFDTYRFLSFSEFHYIPYTNVMGNIDVHIIVPESSNILISLHNGPALFIGATLRALASPRNSVGLVVPDRRLSIPSSLKISSGKCLIPSAYWMMYVILDNIVDRFIQLVDTCTNEVEQLDSLVLDLPAREQTDLLLRIGESRKQISVLRLQLMRKQDILHTIVSEAKDAATSLGASGASITHQDNVIHSVVRSPPGGMTSATSSYNLLTVPNLITPSASPSPSQSSQTIGGGGGGGGGMPPNNKISSIRIFLRDILDHINGMLYDLEQDKETLLNLTNAYQARVTIEMNLAASESNRVMKKFSAMATIILPLTFVPSLWGMNVPVPGEKSSGTWAFWTIVGSLIGVGVIATFIFYKIKWLD
jgi:magnesium transporter